MPTLPRESCLTCKLSGPLSLNGLLVGGERVGCTGDGGFFGAGGGIGDVDLMSFCRLQLVDGSIVRFATRRGS